MKKQTTRSVLLALVLVVWLFPLVSIAAHAASNGHIFGQLLDGSNHNVPLAGQTVTLQMSQNNSGKDLATAKTDAQGTFSFSNLATDKTISYAVYIHYKGAQYVSAIVTLDSKPAQQVNLTVYQPTSSTAKVAIEQATVLVEEPDTQKGLLTISEVFSFENLDTHTYVGSLTANHSKPDALLFSLPVGAQDITLGSGFAGYQEIYVNRGFASNAALLPGENDFSFSFEVPYSPPSYNLSYTTMYPTVALSVMIPPTLEVSASGLQNQGIVTATDQHTYHLFSVDGLLAQHTISVSLGGLTLEHTSIFATLLSTNTIWLLVIIVLMVMVIVGTWFLYRARRRQFMPGLSKSSGTTKSSAQVDRRQMLLQELLNLDREYESGKLTKAGYEERRNKTKARLRALISEQEAVRR